MIESRGRARPRIVVLVMAVFLAPLTLDVGPTRPAARGRVVATTRQARIVHQSAKLHVDRPLPARLPWAGWELGEAAVIADGDDAPSGGDSVALLPCIDLVAPPADPTSQAAGLVGDAADPIPSLRRSVVLRC